MLKCSAAYWTCAVCGVKPSCITSHDTTLYNCRLRYCRRLVL